MSLRVLLIGSGGREHALAWKLAESPLVAKIFAVPGNAGTASIGPKVENVEGVVDDFASLLRIALNQQINLLVPAPDAPIVDGIVDYFRQNGPGSIAAFGPSKAAATMEGSKAFAKDFMKRHKIPTATYEIFTNHAEAQKYLDQNKATKFVIKASGLAAGKGVILPETHEEATAALASIMLDRVFGASGDSVVIEELLEGQELSILSFSDGYTIRSMPAAQDHKRAFDGDKGPNTGGMGCYAPATVATPAITEQIHRDILQPTIDGMRSEMFPFVGCLFTGLMLTKEGPKVLEYNVRFGDPETQTLLPLLESDLAEIMLACTNSWLSRINLKIKPSFSTTVVVAAEGYPGKYGKGIDMLVGAPDEDTFFFHAGTAFNYSNQLVTAGGRVIASTAIGPNIPTSIQKAYEGVTRISFEGMHFRTDIGHRALSQPASTTTSPLTYASAGVSVEAGNLLVQHIKPLVASTARPGADASIGGFGGDISLAAAGYGANAPRLVAAIDGVGTKLLLAQALADVSTVGVDLVAMNVNDLVVQGAEPLAFLDYYATSALDVAHAAQFVAGVAAGCRDAGCALLGGETAEMPGIYGPGVFDAAGCAIGALPAGKEPLPRKAAMRAGDVVVGLLSNGAHANGFSLVRRIVERSGRALQGPAPWKEGATLGGELLTPTKIYVKPLLGVLARGGDRVLGMAHITGGGLTENIPRMLPEGLAARLEVGSWPVPAALEWLRKEGRMEAREFARTFNTGLGMVLVVRAEAVDAVVRELAEAGEACCRVGVLEQRAEGGEGCVLHGLEAWN